MTACIDSDVLIDFFDGIPSAAEEFGRYDKLFISRIAWMEVLIGAPTDELRAIREGFLNQLLTIELDESIARRAIAIRQEHRLKLPDAIIWASAQVNNALLVTRNIKDFPNADPTIRTPYQL